MLSLTKLAVISLVVMAIGALQFVVPAITNQQTTLPTSHAMRSQTNQQNSTQINQPIRDDYQNIQSGTLFFIPKSSDKNETAQPHLLSPLLNTKVDIKVTGIVARTILTQTFKNAGKDWVNGLYVFPLPENAAVDHLLMTVGERKIEGQIKQKSEAKKIYLKAKAEGQKASLVAQQRPNMFSNSIANIGPGETIEVSIEYQQTLNFDQQRYSLRFPMSITPRYQPKLGNDKPEILAEFTDNQRQQTNNKVELDVNLQAGFAVQDIHSEFHPITVKQLSDGSQQIQISDKVAANQDFVLNWRPELGAAPQSAHFTQQVNGDEYGLVMLLPPSKAERKVAKTQQREMILVLDTSGSMEGDSIQQAKQALLLTVDQLQESDTFNIIEFNSYAQNLWKSPKPASPLYKEDAKNFVNSLTANGGTEMESAFKLAFSQSQSKAADTLRQIVFITDGSVSNEESLMRLISNKLENSRLFTVGIGNAPNSYFMTEAAKMGRGTFTYIGSVEHVQVKMLALLAKIQNPAITDIELQLNADILRSNRQLKFYPNIISDLYKGEPIVLSYRLTNDEVDSSQDVSEVNLTARYQGKPWKDNLKLDAKTRQSGLNVLWAKEKINQLTRDKRRASMQKNSSAAEQDGYKSQITETALTHHLVSQYTSLVAVDTTPTLSTDLRPMNSLPKGTLNQLAHSQGRYPKTATSAQLKITLGLILIGLSVCIHLLTRKRIVF